MPWPAVRPRNGRPSDRQRLQAGRAVRDRHLPKARETYQLSLKAYQGGQSDYHRTLAAQRAVAESNLERVRASVEVWRAAGEIAGLKMEVNWPLAPAPERRYP